MTSGAPPHGRVWVVAHRGASWDAPEHTHFAYERAVTDGTDFLEADLWQARDGALVIIHDETVDRTSSGTGAVAALTTAELRLLDFGSWFNAAYPERARPEFAGAGVVLFEEMLEKYRDADPGLRFHVETKHAYIRGGEAGAIDPAMEHELVRVLTKYDLIDNGRVLIQSFWPRSLALVSELTDDALGTALLCPGPGPEDLPAAVDVAAPNHVALLADLDYVDRMHALGREVHTWTVDDPEVMRTLVEAGVDGIFTNRPKVLRQLLEEEFPERAGADRGRRATPP
ncbi:MAG TPA: glycerophosphodiester phosphodiesterase family protein [Acidimicrobiales bacterium]|nr:glycerophosphodiester phosphodiesterase family protein [Acidimicrobiales bacterium]